MCLIILSTCIYVQNLHAWCPWRSEEAIKSLGTGVTESCELPSGNRTWSSARIASALTAEPLLQPTQLFLYLEFFYFSPWKWFDNSFKIKYYFKEFTFNFSLLRSFLIKIFFIKYSNHAFLPTPLYLPNFVFSQKKILTKHRNKNQTRKKNNMIKKSHAHYYY